MPGGVGLELMEARYLAVALVAGQGSAMVPGALRTLRRSEHYLIMYHVWIGQGLWSMRVRQRAAFQKAVKAAHEERPNARRVSVREPLGEGDTVYCYPSPKPWKVDGEVHARLDTEKKD